MVAKRTLSLTLAALALAFAANPASAQRRADIMRELPDLSGTSEKYEVVSVGIGEGLGTFLVLESATLRIVGGRPRAWFSMLSVTGEALILFEANCLEGQVRSLQSYTYDENDKLLISGTQPGAWSYPPPGSFLEAALQRLCRGAR
jgi:hypothetical protein